MLSPLETENPKKGGNKIKGAAKGKTKSAGSASQQAPTPPKTKTTQNKNMQVSEKTFNIKKGRRPFTQAGEGRHF